MIPTLEWLQRRENVLELKIQAGIAEMFAARFSTDEVSEIRDALAEADAEFARGEALTGAEVRRQLGLA